MKDFSIKKTKFSLVVQPQKSQQIYLTVFNCNILIKLFCLFKLTQKNKHSNITVSSQIVSNFTSLLEITIFFILKFKYMNVVYYIDLHETFVHFYTTNCTLAHCSIMCFQHLLPLSLITGPFSLLSKLLFSRSTRS